MSKAKASVASSAYRMNDGRAIPALGIGTWQMLGREEEAVASALRAGYRHIDTAKIYGTEAGVGRAIRGSGIPRKEIFVTTKLWNSDQGYESALRAIDESLAALALEYVDLYLVHWPIVDRTTGESRRKESWRAMEEIQRSGKALSIGVSNYTVEHLREMDAYAKVPPAVDQIRRHPFMQQRDIAAYCTQRGIIVTNYSPLSRGTRINDAALERIARTHDKTEAQILLRWGLQHGNVVIPKASSETHIRENFDVFGFALDESDMETLDGLDEGGSVL